MKFSTLIIMIIVAAALASGCGCKHLETVSVDVEAAALPYVFEFQHIFKTNAAVTIIITNDFEWRNDLEIGRCTYGGNAPNIIHFRKSYWDRAADLDREQIVFHEMGHCVFGLKHNDFLVDYDFGGPAVYGSIMNTKLIDATTYRKYHDEYMKQMYETIYGGGTYDKR